MVTELVHARTPGAVSVAAGGFDHVEMPSEAGQPAARLTKVEFEALPLERRVGLLVRGTLRFYRDGREIAPSQALRAAY